MGCRSALPLIITVDEAFCNAALIQKAESADTAAHISQL
jgi:hypothetical protein